MKTSRSFGLILLGAWVISGCARGPSHVPAESQATGGIQLGLDLAAGAALSQATYTITGPNSYFRSVVVTLGNAPKLSTFIGGTPPGKGYRLTVTGVARDGVSLCTGVSAPFDVIGGKTTVVSLVLRCQEPEPTGSIQTNGSLNYCAAVDALMANPSDTPVGATIALISSSHDKDSGPAPLTFSWAATSGSFDDPAAANPIFTCTAAGSATLTLTITDGDCGDSRAVTVTCTGPAVMAPAPDASAPIVTSDAGAAEDVTVSPDAAGLPPDQCLSCESSSVEPACATRYNICVSLPGLAAAGPARGSPKKDLCVDLYGCVHATRCDVGGILRDCFCGKLVDEYTCGMNPIGPCKAAFYAAGESTSNATILAHLNDPAFALGVGAALIEECEEKPEPLCGPSCGH
jgi:hypothetical protein